jgi:hypothetical protein
MKTPLFCPVCDERVSDGTPYTDPTDELNSTLAEHEDEALVICPHCGSAIECNETECNNLERSADGDAEATHAASPIGPLPAEDEAMQTFAEPDAVTRPDDAIHDSEVDDGAGMQEAIVGEATEAESSDAVEGSDAKDSPSEDGGNERMELELDGEPAALQELSERSSEDEHDAESELETVRENFDDTDIDPPSAIRRDEEPASDAELDWSSVSVASRPRRPERSWLLKLLPPVLGGLTAIPIAIAILWYGFGKDIGGAGPQVARFAPWIVPKHLRGRPYYDSNTSTPSRRNAVTRPPASKPFTWPTPADTGRNDPSKADRDGDIGKRPKPLPDVFPDSTDASPPPTEPPTIPDSGEPSVQQPSTSKGIEATEPISEAANDSPRRPESPDQDPAPPLDPPRDEPRNEPRGEPTDNPRDDLHSNEQTE